MLGQRGPAAFSIFDLTVCIYPCMKKQSLKLTVSPELGSVSGECISPAKPTCVITLAHGAGADMNHIFMTSLAQALAERNIATLRFNFVFTENGKKRPDTPAVAHQAIVAAIAKAKKLFPSLPLFASGKSFGGRMTSQYFSQHHDPAVRGLIFFGFPLHAIGKPGIERAEHLKTVKQPMLFLQGTKDKLAEWELIEQVCGSLATATLIKIDGADHAFKAGKRDVISELAEHAMNWTQGLI